jgi:hypothetical protein
LLLAIALAGCTSTPITDEATEQTVAEILATPAEDAVKSRRCLSVHAYDSVKILDRHRLLFSGIGGKHWLNHLRAPCVGMRRNDTLVFRLHGSQVCSLDSFSAVNDPWWWFNRTSGLCMLGEFQPVTEHQVRLLEEALRVRPRTSDDQP